jgi:hypothetical protein
MGYRGAKQNGLDAQAAISIAKSKSPAFQHHKRPQFPSIRDFMMTLDDTRTLKHEKGGKLQPKSGPAAVSGF